MKYDLIIKNVNAVLENEIKKSDIAVKGPEDIHGLLQPLDADSLFQGITPVSSGHQPPGSSVGSV